MADQHPQTQHGPERGIAFISYAREDARFALRLDETLRLKGVDVRGDWALVKGAGYEEQLGQFILNSDAFVFVITPNSAGSPACHHEIELAVGMKKRILPVLHQDCDENSLHAAVRSPQWTYLRDSDDFVAGMQGLIEAINTDFDLLPEHRRLLAAAETWERNLRQRSYLLRKEGLQKAEIWLTKTSLQPGKLPKPTSLQSEYILASRRAKTKGTRVAFGIVTAIALMMTLLSVVALAQRTIAKRNEQLARDNEQEAKLQKKQADTNAEEARYQAGVAKTNEEKAKEQQKIAEDNATEAKRQQEIAEDNAEEARKQKGIAVANAEEAIRRIIRLNMANGFERLDQQDYPGAAVWLSEALKLTKGDEQKDARIRMATLLGDYPQPEQAFFGDARILSASYSPDGQRIVTTHADRTAHIWDAKTGKSLTPPLTHKTTISSVAFSPDGRDLVTVSLGKSRDVNLSRLNRDPYIRELQRVTALPNNQEALKKLDPVLADFNALTALLEKLQKSDDEQEEQILKGRPYLKAEWDLTSIMINIGYFQIWDVETGRALTKRMKETFIIDQVEYAPDGKHFMVWGSEGARLWNVNADHVLSPTVGSGGYVKDAAISPDGKRYAIGGYGSQVHVYDTASGKSLFHVEAGTGSSTEVEKVCFSSDGALLATGDRYGNVRLWNAKTGDSLTDTSANESLKLPDRISVLTFSPDDKLLLAGTGSINPGAFKLWEAKTGNPVTYEQHVKFPIVAAQFSPDSTRLLTTIRKYPSGQSETIIWETPEIDSGPPMMTMRTLAPPVLDTNFAMWDPTGQRILTTGPHTVARTWNVDTHPGFVPASSVAGFNGLFWAQITPNKNVQVVDAENRAIGLPIKMDWDDPRVAVSSDGKRVAIGVGARDSEGTVRVWDVATGQPLTPEIKQRFFVHQMEFSRDGTQLLTCWYDHDMDNGWARVWNASTGEPISPQFTDGDAVKFARFDPTGRRVVTVSHDGSITVWDALTGKEIGPRITHPRGASRAMFNTDGTLILSLVGYQDSSDIRLWDSRTGQPKTPPMLHPQLRSVEFSADGRFILSIGFETIRLWIAETGEPLSPFIPAASARWHVREPRLFVEPRAGYYKTPWVQAHNTPLVWDLTPSTERAESLGLLTEFIAARRVDRAGALVELDAQSLRQVWEAFKSGSAAPQYRAR